MARAKKPQSAAQNEKSKQAQKSAKNERSAAKRGTQQPKDNGSKGAKPAPVAERERKPAAQQLGTEQKKKARPNLGKILRGRTKYIDVEPKEERNYVVVVDNGKKISVSKVKSIKIFDENGRNADKALVEINATRYGLEERTGVDFEVFSENRMSGKPLRIDDKDVFPEDKERGTLGSHDLSRVLVHTGRALRGKKKRGK